MKEIKEKRNPAQYTRRDFLVLVIGVLGGILAFIMGGVGLLSFFSPAWKKREDAWVEVGPLSRLKDGKPVMMDYIQRKMDGWLVKEGRSSVWLLKQGAKVTAYNPQCTHLGCPYHWDAAKGFFMCPCHSGVFSKDGKVVSGPPPRPLDRFDVKVEQGMVMVLPSEKKA